MSFLSLQNPPASPVPYILPALGGEAICIPTSNSVMRLLVTGEASARAFGIVSTEGKAEKPIGFHYHNDAHDIFICLRGRIIVWAETQDGDKIKEARVLEPGDFASVPPRTIHQYQCIAQHTSFIGLIVPGGWEHFFRTIGDPYNGVLFPTDDKRPFATALLPRLKDAAGKHDMVPQAQHQTWMPSSWNDMLECKGTSAAKIESPPECLRPYFLRASSGPKRRLGGNIVRRMCGIKESDGRFTVSELSGLKSAGILPALVFHGAHHCFYVIEGSLNITMADVSATEPYRAPTQVVNAGETAFVPANKPFQLNWMSRWGRAYVFCNQRGIAGVLEDLGEDYGEATTEEQNANIDRRKIENLAKTQAFSLA